MWMPIAPTDRNATQEDQTAHSIVQCGIGKSKLFIPHCPCRACPSGPAIVSDLGPDLSRQIHQWLENSRALDEKCPEKRDKNMPVLPL
jgi:hypothetical protein